MSSIDHVRRWRGGSALAALIHASAMGLAASVIHGAFDRVAVRGRQRPPRPRERAATPQPVPERRAGWWQILKRTFAEVNADRVLAVAGGVTFYGLLSLFPAITVLVSLYGLLADRESIAGHLGMLGTVLPEGAMSIISEQVARIAAAGGTGLSLAAIIGTLIALWSANAAMKAMMDALNIAYDTEETRSFLRLNLVSLAFTLSAIVGLIVLFAGIAAVPVLLDLVWLGATADVLIWAGRWPVIFLMVILALAVLYRFAPDRPNVRWRWVTPGSFIAALGLLALSMLFSWYAANIGKFNETYGSLGAVIGFMTWMWLSATIILAGAELNAEVENAKRRSAPAQPAGRPSR
jgi:membrane protein